MRYPDIYAFIKGEEAAFNRSIDINGWRWNFKEHVKTSFYYKHGRLLNGNTDDRPVKNITRPILNLQYRAEDIDVKDIVLFVDDPNAYHLSFLVKKYHDDVFSREHDLDKFIDEWKESRIDYGAGLAKKGKEARPEVIDLQSIAFCDQTDMLKGPIAFKHFLNPAELKDMEASGWGNPANGATASVDELIALADTYRATRLEEEKNETPGSYIEIYEVHGVLPDAYLTDGDSLDTYSRQFHIIGFYKDRSGERTGVTLFRKKAPKQMLKVTQRDHIYSRALGFGGAEELFEPQVWTNYDVIRMKELLDATSKIVLKAIGSQFKSRYPNGLKDVDNLEIIELNQGEDLQQIDTTPKSMALFEKDVTRWEDHARITGAATDPLLGESAPAGTPFSAQALQVSQAQSLHDYRMGKYAKDLEAVYMDWIIPHIIDRITDGFTFLSELSTEEMQYVSDCLVRSMSTKWAIDEILSGNPVTQEQLEVYKDKVREEFVRKGNKHFLKILKGEFKKQPVKVKISIKGKQKDLARVTDAMVNIFRQILANPQGFMQMMQVPELSQTFNSILEFSGLTPVMYAGLKNAQALAPQPTALQASPVSPTQQPLTPQNGV